MRYVPVSFAVAAVLLTPFVSRAQSEEVSAIRAQLRPIKSSEAEIRMPALYEVKKIAVSSPHTAAKLAGLSLLREPVKSGLDYVRIPAMYAIADIATSSDDVAVERDALDALYEPIKAGSIAPRLVAIDALNIIMANSTHCEELLPTALRLLNEPVDSSTDSVRMPAVNSIVSLVENSGNDAAYRQALTALSQPIRSNRKEVRFMTIDAVERIGIAATSEQVKQAAIDVLKHPKGSDWSEALVERAFHAEFRIRESR